MVEIAKRKAIVFGANGSIGSETVRQLGDRGVPTLAIVRSGKRSEVPEQPQLQIFEVDSLLDSLTDRDVLKAARGTTEIYYTPANFNQGRTRHRWIRERFPGKGFAQAYDLNVVTPDLIHRFAEEAGVERFVYLSSIAVYGAQRGVVTEETPLTGNGMYAVSKRIGEEVLLANRGYTNTPVTVMRPSNVFGPGAEIWSEALYQRFSQRGNDGRFIPGTGEGLMPPVDIRDVASSMIRAVETPKAAGEVYNLASDDSLTLRELGEYFQILTDISPQLTPAIMVKALGRILDAKSYLTGQAVQFTSESVVNLLDTTRVISNEKAKRDLGIEFRSADEIMIDSLLWLNEKHELGREEVIFDYVAQKSRNRKGKSHYA